jgi:mono/diheme cytochrome c family protein
VTHGQTMSTAASFRRRGVALALALAAGAVGTLAPRGADARPGQQRTGQQVFASTCAACHQAQGEGTDVYPPLAGSEFVTGNEARLVRIVLHGLVGEVEVQGQPYSGAMPGWAPTLSDAEIAAVTTYIRSSWGNAAPAVAAATVAQLRAAHAGRTTPWTLAELAKIIPVEKH